MGFILGIDGGGSKTECVLADESGAVLARAEGPATNLNRTSPEQLREILAALLGRLERTAGLDRPEYEGVCAGFAGAGREENRSAAEAVLRELARPRSLAVVGDMEVALAAAAGDGPGLVLISGTGSIAYGRNAGGGTARAGGEGPEAGDRGSGTAIGRAALQLLLDGEAGEALGAELAVALPEPGEEALRSLLTSGDATHFATVATLATLVVAVERAAGAGSAQAGEILSAAGKELAGLVFQVSRKLGMASGGVKVFATGGAIAASSRLFQAAARALEEAAPGAKFGKLEISPAEGAIRMALRLRREC